MRYGYWAPVFGGWLRNVADEREASWENLSRLVRRSGNDDELVDLATRNAEAIAAGHTFVILLRDGFPLNVLNPVKAVPEVCGIFCATANPVEVVVAVTPLGRGVVGVIDGQPPLGVETDADVADRRALLRAIGYKL